MKILIPMAGLGSRFASAGYSKPKPLIDVLGKPMIQQVIQNLSPTTEVEFIFICQKQHLIDTPAIRQVLLATPGNPKIIEIDGLTEGAACTALLAQEFIDNDTPLVIANCDQMVDADLSEFYQACKDNDGAILTFTADDPKWSFVRKNKAGDVLEVVEKKVISDEATVGIYGFSKGSAFCQSAREMIKRNDRVNGEFYVAPAYNYMIEAGSVIKTIRLDETKKEVMWGIGTPDDLDAYLLEKS